MADLVVTAANVAQAANVTRETGTAGETLTAGQSVYLKSTDSKYYKAKASGTAEEAGSNGFGVALHGALANQPITVQKGGTITIGATVAVGTEYVISATYGGIAPRGDLVSTNKYTRLGYATTTTIIQLDEAYTGLVIP